MNVKKLLQLFVGYLQIERNYSKYTIASYQNDLEHFVQFMERRHILFLDITYADVRLYLTTLHDEKLAIICRIGMRKSEEQSHICILNAESTPQQVEYAM